MTNNFWLLKLIVDNEFSCSDRCGCIVDGRKIGLNGEGLRMY